MNFFLRPYCVAVLLAAAFLAAPAWADTPALKLTASNWTPYLDSSRAENGVVAVMVTTAFERAGYTTTLTFEPWPASLEKTQTGEFDVHISTWKTPERAKDLALSEPFLFNRITLMGKGSKPYSIYKKEDLEGLRIGVVDDYAYSAKKYNTAGLKIVSSASVEESVTRLLEGELDIIVGDRMTMRHQVDKESAARQVTISPDTLATRGLRIAVSREREDHEAIVEAFNTAISEMQEDGTYNSILGGYGISQ
ncbi:MAG: transporter substrate-binding domain-containing protein [Pseudomonadota bacterium]